MAEKSKWEEQYDEKIRPLVDQIDKACEELGFPFMIAVHSPIDAEEFGFYLTNAGVGPDRDKYPKVLGVCIALLQGVGNKAKEEESTNDEG